MQKEDLRLVEYNLTNNVKGFKITPNHPENKKGIFHLWRVERKAYANEYFIGLIEDYSTGELMQLSCQNIKFLTINESEDFLKAPQFEINLADNDGVNDWVK